MTKSYLFPVNLFYFLYSWPILDSMPCYTNLRKLFETRHLPKSFGVTKHFASYFARRFELICLKFIFINPNWISFISAICSVDAISHRYISVSFPIVTISYRFVLAPLSSLYFPDETYPVLVLLNYKLRSIWRVQTFMLRTMLALIWHWLNLINLCVGSEAYAIRMSCIFGNLF